MEQPFDTPLPEETRQQLEILCRSKQLLGPIFAGLALQYQALDNMIVRLLKGEEAAPDPKSLQLTSSLFILSSLLGYQKQAACIDAQTAAAGGCPDGVDTTLGMLVILVSITRFFRLLCPQSQTQEELTQDVQAL